MFQVDLKKAEVAMAAGRLEEAFERLRGTSGKEHRHGQRLMDRLVDALIARGKIHLDQGRLMDARADVRRAEELAGRQVVVADLLQQISLRDDSVAGRAHQRDLDDVTSKLQSSVDLQDWDGALGILAGLAPTQTHEPSIASIHDQVTREIFQRGMEEFQEGRVDKAFETARNLRRLPSAPSFTNELHRLIQVCASAQGWVKAGRFADALTEMGRLMQMQPECAWIKTAHTGLKTIVDGTVTLQNGPLGLMNEGDVTLQSPMPKLATLDAPAPRFRRSTAPSILTDEDHDAPMNQPMVLQVDGLGSMLLVRADITTMGRSGTTPPPDVALQADGMKHSIVYRRDGEDYWAESQEGLIVNDQTFPRRLLSDGDVLRLGRRGRVRFSKPVAASGSAVLHLAGVRLQRGDIRQVVLLADSLLLGPAGSHFSWTSAKAPIILQPSPDGFLLHEQGTAARHRLELGGSVSLCGTRFSISPAVPGRTH